MTGAALAQDQKRIELCARFEKLATSTMSARQSGVPLGETIAVAKKFEEIDEKLSQFLVELTIKAYKIHKFASPDNQQNAITEFANQTMLQCLQSKK